MHQEAPFEVLISRFQGRVYAQALGLLGNPADAEEVAQEAFVKAYEHRDEFRDPGSFGGWIGSIVSRLVADHRRTRRSRETGREAIDTPPSRDPLETEERSRALWDEVRAMQPDYRTAFLMVHLEGLPYRDVASQLSVPLSTVEGRMYKARQILREKLRWL